MLSCRAGCLLACHAGSGHDPVAALLFCTPAINCVDLSVINGHIVVQDGRLLTLDLQVGFYD